MVFTTLYASDIHFTVSLAVSELLHLKHCSDMVRSFYFLNLISGSRNLLTSYILFSVLFSLIRANVVSPFLSRPHVDAHELDALFVLVLVDPFQLRGFL